MSENRILTFASVECFTHCEIGMTIHKRSAPYVKNRWNIAVVFSSFLPSINIAKKLFNVNLPSPNKEINGIKIYNEEGDKEVSLVLSKHIKALLNVDITVASSAGEGRGAVVVRFKNKCFLVRSLFSIPSFEKATEKDIKRRKYSAKKRTIRLIESLIFNNPLPTFVEEIDG
ncbi:FeGP cofactor biosynthesis protein HcgF family protein [Desulfurobacterium thermolithotrophum]|uniref:FeGP cofactor biosynthesis protein HcgF family protein n=1 Tax=Desulfurobacterium thermolithotrophum TaxID=64160 RepID=UPI0013D76893|nr:FeGP cofactor biosynthesis protein HcgF family protein [Desulfurobacterium thermolithotrophum]